MSSSSITLNSQNGFPVEFVVSGSPVSLQSSRRSRERWKSQVEAAARECVSEQDEFLFLDDRPLAVTIYVFLDAAMVGDVDNIVKPILDSLNRIIYLDDKVIERVLVQKFEPHVAPVFSAPTAQLLRALDESGSRVYIRIDDDLSWRRT